jgi:hypothetical protein
MITARRFYLALATLSLLTLVCALPARADTTGTWMGKVVYINASHIGVQAEGKTRDFILGSDTGYSSNGKKAQHGDVTEGMLVVVSYSRSAMFGATRATSIDVKTFSMPAPASTP